MPELRLCQYVIRGCADGDEITKGNELAQAKLTPSVLE